MAPRFDTRSDADLLSLIASEPEAFDAFWRRYETAVVAFLMRRTRDAHMAADLASETFATVLLRAGRFKDDGTPAIGWLLGIARNLLLEALRRDRIDARAHRKLGAERTTDDDAALERIEALADSVATAPKIMRALDSLPPAQRDAVCAYILDERPYDEVADILGVSEATVRKRVSRGLARMKTSLNGTP